MNIRDYISFLDEVGDYEIEELMKDGNYAAEKILPILKDLSDASSSAKEILTSKVSEKDLVKLIMVIQKFTAVAALSEGNGASIMIAELSGELKGYTESVALAIMGVLIESEVL